MFLSNFLALLVGSPLPLESPLRQELNQYKNAFLYDDEYKICREDTQLQVFDEPLKCLSADYITFYATNIFGEDLQYKVNIFDSIHPERVITTSEFEIRNLSNRRGELFYMVVSLPYEHISKSEVLEVVNTINKKIGSPVGTGKGFDISYQWITSDGFDVRLKEGLSGYVLEYSDRGAYNEINNYMQLKRRESNTPQKR